MDDVTRIANAIRTALDETGNEIDWSATMRAAQAVHDSLADVFDDAWRYGQVCK